MKKLIMNVQMANVLSKILGGNCYHIDFGIGKYLCKVVGDFDSVAVCDAVPLPDLGREIIEENELSFDSYLESQKKKGRILEFVFDHNLQLLKIYEVKKS